MGDLFRKYLGSFLLSLLILGGIILTFSGRYISFLSKKYYYRETPEIRQTKDFEPDGKQTTITPEEYYGGAVIDYSAQGFAKPEIDITRPGCSLKITNSSSKPLTLRLGPYEQSKKDNYGQKYPDIGPGESMLIDPRYGRPKEEYLNYKNPSQKFYANIDRDCSPTF